MQLQPNQDSAKYAVYTNNIQHATVGVHLGKKVGDNITGYWASDVASVAPAYDVTLLHLERRNAFLPVSSSAVAPAASDLQDHALTLVNEGYSQNVADGMVAQMSNTPSHVYLDVLRGQVFTSPKELVVPVAGTYTRNPEETSPLMKRIVRNARAIHNSKVTIHKSQWFAGTAATAQSSFNDILLGVTMWQNSQQLLDRLIPAGCTVMDVTADPSGYPRVLGAVYFDFHWYNNDPAAVDDFDYDKTFLILPPYGQEEAWADECFSVYATKNAANGVTVFEFRNLVDPDQSFGVHTSETHVARVVQSVSGYMCYLKMNSYYTVQSAPAGLTALQPFGLYGSPLTGTAPVYKTRILDALPYSQDLARKIELYLMGMSGVADAGAGYELDFLCKLISEMHFGQNPTMVPAAIRWESDPPAYHRPRPVDSYLVHIGYTNSIYKPGSGHMYITDIIQDALLTDKDSRPAPIIKVSGTPPADQTVAKPVITYTNLTGADVHAVMTRYQARPDFPADITQPMIDDMATQGMCALLIPSQTKASMTWNHSALYGTVVENVALDGDTFYVSRDENGVPVSYNEGLTILAENGFFDDTINQLVLLPSATPPAAPPKIVVTIDPTLDPSWDTGLANQATLRVKYFANDGTIALEPSANFLTTFYDSADAENHSLRWALENNLRAFLGEDQLTAEPVANEVEFSPLDPSNYITTAPLKYADLSGIHQKYLVPFTGAYVDLAMIQKDLKPVVRHVYNAVMLPLISKVDPF